MRQRAHMSVGVLTLSLLWPSGAAAQHVHGEPTATTAQEPPAGPLPSFIPVPTDADRAAAFPDVGDHEAHGTSIHSLVSFDHLEWQSGTGSLALDARGWVGGDLHRFLFRADGRTSDGDADTAALEVFYGRAFARWWDVVAGVRQDVQLDVARTWAAVGLQGLAPYWFDLDVTAYVGESWNTQLRVAVEYDLLLTNRLIIQPSAFTDVFGRADPERHVGAGVSSVEAAIRLRYEIRRELAPYAGVVWQWRAGDTAEMARAAGDPVSDTRVVLGARVWF